MSDQYDAFLSYTRFDDQHDGEFISKLHLRLTEEIRAQTGKPFMIFKDVDNIRWGERWDSRIIKILNEVKFFIPIITPSFLTSDGCRDEFERFLEIEKRRGRDDLILPLYYITAQPIERPADEAQDPIVQLLLSRQLIDWRALRGANRARLNREVVGLAARMAERLECYEANPPPTQSLSYNDDGHRPSLTQSRHGEPHHQRRLYRSWALKVSSLTAITIAALATAGTGLWPELRSRGLPAGHTAAVWLVAAFSLMTVVTLTVFHGVGGDLNLRPRLRDAPLPAVPSELPPDVDVFTNRISELDVLRASVRRSIRRKSNRTIVLYGKPGAGKTSLAVHIAHHFSGEYSDGAIFIDLHGMESIPTRPVEVAQHILQSLGEALPATSSDEDLLSYARTAVSRRQLILLLDNGRDERQVAPILPGSGCWLLIVTRSRVLSNGQSLLAAAGGSIDADVNARSSAD